LKDWGDDLKPCKYRRWVIGPGAFTIWCKATTLANPIDIGGVKRLDMATADMLDSSNFLARKFTCGVY
jgi:hypothetical protein